MDILQVIVPGADGVHVNSVQAIEGADEFRVDVKSPVVRFAGVADADVFYYRFESQEQADQFIGAPDA